MGVQGAQSLAEARGVLALVSPPSEPEARLKHYEWMSDNIP